MRNFFKAHKGLSLFVVLAVLSVFLFIGAAWDSEVNTAINNSQVVSAIVPLTFTSRVDTFQYNVRTGASRMYMILEASSLGMGVKMIYTNSKPAMAAAYKGTNVVLYNMNLSRTNSTGTYFYREPSYTNVGTTNIISYALSGQNMQLLPSKMILQAGKSYFLRFYNNTYTTNQSVVIRLLMWPKTQ